MALLLGLVLQRVMSVSGITCNEFHQPAGGSDTVKSYRVPPVSTEAGSPDSGPRRWPA